MPPFPGAAAATWEGKLLSDDSANCCNAVDDRASDGMAALRRSLRPYASEPPPSKLLLLQGGPPVFRRSHDPAPPRSLITPMLSPMEAKTFTHEDICGNSVGG